MLASHDVFSHTGPPIAKIKRGVWFVLLPTMPVSNWRDHPLPYSYWGLVFACCFIVCLLLECRIEGTVGLHYWLLCAEERISHTDSMVWYGGYCCTDLLQ